MSFPRNNQALLPAAILLAVAYGAAVQAQTAGDVPDDLQDVGIEQNLDARIPPDLRFVDEAGRAVSLQDYFRGDKPVLLTLGYYRCPMLCNLVLDGLVEALQQIDWTPGDQFDIVTVSIDPREDSQLARQKKQSYLRAYGKPGADAGWHFLTGEAPAIESLAETVGFRYRYLPERKEFSHSAALFLLTPDGRVSRYLFGVRHDPRTLRLSLVEASEGKIGSVIDQFLLYCYRYDAESGRYSAVAWRIMRLGGLLTLLVLGAVLLNYWIREMRQRRDPAWGSK